MGDQLQPGNSFAEIYRDLDRNWTNSGGLIVASRKTAYGQHYWRVLFRSNGGRFISLSLIERTGGLVRTSAQDERSGLPYYDCPQDLFAYCAPPTPLARQWRQQVRDHQLDQTEADRVRFAINERVRIGDQTYQVRRLPSGQGRTYGLSRESDGRIREATARLMRRL